MVSNFIILKTVTFFVLSELFWCLRNPPKSDMDYRIFNVLIIMIFCMRGHMRDI